MQLNIYRELENEREQEAQPNVRSSKEPSVQLVGTLNEDGSFAYDATYLTAQDARPISFSLPLQCDSFSREQALPYFKGLLPEGNLLSNLAMRLGKSEDDYPGILCQCGLDCVGDITFHSEATSVTAHYRKTDLDEMRSLLAGRQVASAVEALTASRLSLAGTQDKIGLYTTEVTSDLSDDSGWYLPVNGAPSNCILKVAPKDSLPDLMVAEQLAMACARSCGIAVAETELVPIDRGAIVVKRFDRESLSMRVIDGHRVPERRHQEDFAQALGLTPGSKYAELADGTARAIANFLQAYSEVPAIDIRNLLALALYNYAIGNADNHLKNLSLLYSPSWKTIRLAPAYDIVPTTHYARFSRQMAMALGSTRDIDAITIADLYSFACAIGVSERMLKKIAKTLSAQIVPALRIEAKRLAERGFEEALYLADGLEDDVIPRIKVLQSV